MKQTAVEWLMDEAMKLVVQYMQGTLNYDTLDDVIYEIGTKAKAMEKEQIMDAFLEGYLDDIPDPLPRHYYEYNAEKYYEQKFKTE